MPDNQTTGDAFRKAMASLFANPSADLKQAARNDGVNDIELAQIAMELREGKTDD